MRLAPTVVGENLGDIRVRRKKQQQGEKEKKKCFLKAQSKLFPSEIPEKGKSLNFVSHFITVDWVQEDS